MTLTIASQASGAPYVVQQLGPQDRPEILQHLIALDPADRALRFGASIDDAALARYAETMEFERGTVFAARAPGGALLGVAHLAIDNGIAELGVSVGTESRQIGVATALAAAALREAERRRAREFRLHSAATNTGMRRLAQRLRMTITVDGSELLARRALARPLRAPRIRTEVALEA